MRRFATPARHVSRLASAAATGFVVTALALLMPGPAALHAAGTGVVSDGGREPATVVIGTPSFRTWDIEPGEGDAATLSQFHLPLALTVPLGNRLDLVGYVAVARSTFEPDEGEEASLEGLVDGRLKLAFRPTSRFQITAGLGLPFGDGALDEPEEVAVAQLLWAPILDFRSKRAGEGMTIEANAAYAAPLSPMVTLGLGAGGVLGSEYDLFDTGDTPTTFRSGTELSASIGFDVRPSDITLYRLDVAARTFGDDEVNGRAAFRAATRVEVDVTAATAPDSWLLALRGRGVFRGEDRRYSGDGDDEVRRQVAGSDALYALVEAYRELGETAALGLEAEAGRFGESDAALSDGSRVGAGPGLRLGRPGATRAQFRAQYLSGSAESGAVDLSGWDFSAGVFLVF